MRIGEQFEDEERIERTLAGLRGVEPPIGLEERVLRAVLSQPARVEQRRRATWQLVSMPVAALVLVALLLQGRRPSVAPRHGPERSLPSLNRPERAELPVKPPVERIRMRSRAVRFHKPVHGDRQRSFPAPEPPLNEQERLLLVIARTGHEPEWALLNPEKRADEDATRSAAFNDFLRSNP